MNRLLLLIVLAALPAATAAQDLFDPTTCPVSAGSANAIAVEHQGKTYYVVNEVCRDAFIAEPERYAQLFDALAELEAEGRTPPPQTDTSSLVPS